MEKHSYWKGIGGKIIVLAAALALIVVCTAGTTLAWLQDSTEQVTNTFAPSNITITLKETKTDFKMIPGWTIDKDPKVTVKGGSEDCWLFVKIQESASPDLDAYIAYEIAGGWDRISQTDDDTVILARKVKKSDSDQSFCILGAGSYTGEAGTVTWGENQVGVKCEVTDAMMDEITGSGKAQPTLTFQVAAVQLYESNNAEFSREEALNEVVWPQG